MLKGGGHAQFIVHHSDSIIVRNAQESLERTSLVLNDTKIFRKLRRHLEGERRSPAAARRTWEELVAAVTRLQTVASQAKSALTLHVTIDAVQKLLNARQQLSRAAMDREIDHVESDIRASVRRLQDLVASAQSKEGIGRIKGTAEFLGFIGCEASTQYHAGVNLVGWRPNLGKL